MPATATVISVCRRQVIEIEEALVEEITSMLGEVTSTVGTKGSGELLRLMEQLAALRVIGQQLSLQVKVRDYDFGFDDDYCYDGRLAEVEELANLTEHLLRPALEKKGHKGLIAQTTTMLSRLDQSINKVNDQTVTIDYSELELDEDDLPPALLALVVPDEPAAAEESKDETAPLPVPPPARKALRGKPNEQEDTPDSTESEPVKDDPPAKVRAEDEIEAHSNRKGRKKTGKQLKNSAKKKRNRR